MDTGGHGRARSRRLTCSRHLVEVNPAPYLLKLTEGLRPLLNLSQTCFLSAILQALIHNPLLKAYFLSDKHNRHVCPNGGPRGLNVGRPNFGDPSTANGNGTPADRERGCMCCEMDRAFDEFYNDDTSPFGPITMLYAMWHASSELEGHGQQDAHAFFLAALDQIHAHAKGQLSSCNCIARKSRPDPRLTPRPNLCWFPGVNSNMFSLPRQEHNSRPNPRHPTRLPTSPEPRDAHSRRPPPPLLRLREDRRSKGIPMRLMRRR